VREIVNKFNLRLSKSHRESNREIVRRINMAKQIMQQIHMDMWAWPLQHIYTFCSLHSQGSRDLVLGTGG
jgi:hypothetical protein